MNARLQQWFGVQLEQPEFLGFLLLVPLALWWRSRQPKPSLAFAPASLWQAAALPATWRLRVHWIPGVGQVLGFGLLLFALAKPVQKQPVPQQHEGIDILLCIDISSSMSSNDLDRFRTRLDVAKDAARQFVRDRPHDRIGLIQFAGFPDLLCPLTLDHSALDQFLLSVQLVEAEGPEDLTGIGTAVAKAAQVLASSRARSKVVVLLTDGEENVASAQTPDEIGPLKAAQLCMEHGIRVYCIAAGIGKPGASGRMVALDTRQVEQLAARTGGQFFQARDAGRLRAVYANINEMETQLLEEQRYQWVDRFLPFLVSGALLYVASRSLRYLLLEVRP